jgi:hypothetical protein
MARQIPATRQMTPGSGKKIRPKQPMTIKQRLRIPSGTVLFSCGMTASLYRDEKIVYMYPLL